MEFRYLYLGNWYAMTGYGVAFPRHSKHFPNFNKKVMDYSENGNISFILPHTFGIETREVPGEIILIFNF